ncbi:MAG: PIN domain-containing protein [Opitutales bacterium]|nr:PIN domain-containing protein [Opitutales bacterium]
MRALFDTNVLLDMGLARKPFAEKAVACFHEAWVAGVPPRLAPHTLATFYYIVAQARGKKRAGNAIRDLLAVSEVVRFDHDTAMRSIDLKFGDFEDAMIAAAAEASEVECIVTRNGRDFKTSPVPALSPEAFLKRLRD